MRGSVDLETYLAVRRKIFGDAAPVETASTTGTRSGRNQNRPRNKSREQQGVPQEPQWGPAASGRARQEVTNRDAEARGSPTGGQPRGGRGRRRVSALERYGKAKNVEEEEEGDREAEQEEDAARQDSEEDGEVLSGDEEEEERTGAVLSLEEVSYDRDVKWYNKASGARPRRVMAQESHFFREVLSVTQAATQEYSQLDEHYRRLDHKKRDYERSTRGGHRGRDSRLPRRDDRAYMATERREDQRVGGSERAGQGMAEHRGARREGGPRGVVEEREEEEGQEQQGRNRRSGAERRRRRKKEVQEGSQQARDDAGKANKNHNEGSFGTQLLRKELDNLATGSFNTHIGSAARATIEGSRLAYEGAGVHEYEYGEPWMLGRRGAAPQMAPVVKPAAASSYKESPQPDMQGLEAAHTFLSNSLMAAGPWTAMQGVSKDGDECAHARLKSTTVTPGLG